jgi:hypothetical protein
MHAGSGELEDWKEDEWLGLLVRLTRGCAHGCSISSLAVVGSRLPT